MTAVVAAFDELFDAFASGHASSARGVGETSLDLAVAGRSISVRFAGAACADALGPALSHLAAKAEADPDLTILMWDSAGAGVEPPRLNWSGLTIGPKSTLPQLSRSGGHAAFDLYAGVAQVYDVERRCAICWTEDAGRLPYWDRSFPFRQTLAWFFAPTSALPMHAACLACDGRGLLLPGVSGSGKSTTALRLALDGFGFLGDDYVLVDAGPSCRIWSLYRTAKVDARSLSLLPEIGIEATRLRPQDDKSVVYWPMDRCGTVVRDIALSAVVLPRVDPSCGASRLAPATPGDVVLALAPTTLNHLDVAPEKVMAAARAAAAAAPAYHLHLGPDHGRLASLLRSVLER